MNIVLALVMVVFLVGCSASKVKTEYKYINKPVLVCPAPSELNGGENVPAVPSLEIYKLNPSSSDGEVARAFQLSIIQLKGHIELLRNIIDGYDKTSKEYEKLKGIMDAMYPDGTVIQPSQ